MWIEMLKKSKSLPRKLINVERALAGRETFKLSAVKNNSNPSGLIDF